MRSLAKILVICAVGGSLRGNAASPNRDRAAFAERLAESAPTSLLPPYHSFTHLALARNFPALGTSSVARPGVPHPVVGYRYLLSNEWSLGLTLQFKMLSMRASGSDLALLAFAQETSYNVRLYHPFYLLVGVKLQYFLPSTRAMLPFRRHPDYSGEFGTAASLGLCYFLTPRFYMELRLDRWRGTKTMRLHGLETALAAGFAF